MFFSTDYQRALYIHCFRVRAMIHSLSSRCSELVSNYSNWVRNNPGQVSQAESALKWSSYILSGEILWSEIFSWFNCPQDMFVIRLCRNLFSPLQIWCHFSMIVCETRQENKNKVWHQSISGNNWWWLTKIVVFSWINSISGGFTKFFLWLK